MMTSDQQKIRKAINLFKNREGVLRTSDILSAGIHPRTLYKLRDEGIIIRLERGLYKLNDEKPLTHPDLVIIATRIPSATICLLSALDFHGMTKEIPHRVHIAIARTQRDPKIDHPPLQVYRFSGESILIVSADEDGETVTYEDLLEINGHVRIYLKGDTDNILASADIGGNALTGESLDFDLDEVDGSAVNGEVEFFERRNGTLLAVIELNGISGDENPAAHLYEEDSENGTPLFVFNTIDSETGVSKSNIEELEDGTPFDFEDLEDLEAYINIYTSESDMTVIARTDIGNN